MLIESLWSFETFRSNIAFGSLDFYSNCPINMCVTTNLRTILEFAAFSQPDTPDRGKRASTDDDYRKPHGEPIARGNVFSIHIPVGITG